MLSRGTLDCVDCHPGAPSGLAGDGMSWAGMAREREGAMKAIVAPLFLLVASWGLPSWAGPADDCIECHAKATEKTAAGKAAKVVPEDLAGSVHKRVKGG